MRKLSAAVMVIAIMCCAGRAVAQSDGVWLGATLEVVEAKDLPVLGIPGGLKVTNVAEKSPAQEAGLEVGDIVLSAGQDSVSTIEGLRKILAGKRPGDMLSLGVRKAAGKTEPLLVTLGRQPSADDKFADDARVKELREQLQKLDVERRRVMSELEKRLSDLRNGKADKVGPQPAPRVDNPPQPEPETPKPVPEEPRAPLAVSLGAAVESLTPEESKTLGIEGGVKVSRVVASGAAEEAGVKTGDIVVKAGGEALTGTGHLRMVLSKLNPGDKLELEVLREGKKQNIAVTLRPAK